MSHGYTTTSWVRENLPELTARGPDIAREVIEKAIQDTRAKRFRAVLITMLLPAVVVNSCHAEIVDMLGATISRIALLSVSLVVSAITASLWSRRMLHERIRTLAHTDL